MQTHLLYSSTNKSSMDSAFSCPGFHTTVSLNRLLRMLIVRLPAMSCSIIVSPAQQCTVVCNSLKDWSRAHRRHTHKLQAHSRGKCASMALCGCMLSASLLTNHELMRECALCCLQYSLITSKLLHISLNMVTRGVMHSPNSASESCTARNCCILYP